MDIGRSFSFVTEDPRWLSKLALACLVVLLSAFLVPAPLLLGYLVRLVRNVSKGVERPLPEWDDLGAMYMDGLYLFLAQIIYSLPLSLVVCLAVVAAGGLGNLGALNEQTLAPAVVAVLIGLSCLAVLLILASAVLQPALTLQYARTDDFGALLRVGEVGRIARQNLGDILVTTGVALVVSLALSAVLFALQLIPCLGQIAAPVLGLAALNWLVFSLGHLYGQIEARNRGVLPAGAELGG